MDSILIKIYSYQRFKYNRVFDMANKFCVSWIFNLHYKNQLLFGSFCIIVIVYIQKLVHVIKINMSYVTLGGVILA